MVQLVSNFARLRYLKIITIDSLMTVAVSVSSKKIVHWANVCFIEQVWINYNCDSNWV